MQGNEKALVRFLHSIDEKHFFFFIWFAIVSFFLVLIFGYYKKMSQRNFKQTPDRKNIPTTMTAAAKKDVNKVE